jgi:hypothetical protein
MHHAPAINVWKGTNRVSLLWEDLRASRVSPDPCAWENISPGVDPETLNRDAKSIDSRSEPGEVTEPSLLEKAGFESLRLIKYALDILAAPPEDEPAADNDREQDLTALTASQSEWVPSGVRDPLRADAAVGLTFIKVSREPEPQPGSAIDTRRMAYGLKIPVKPLHKRSIYQRVFFCLCHMMGRGKEESSMH